MSNASDKKHYIAFISYSTADEKWAKWLWYQLEYYRVPQKLRKEYPLLPKNLRPIFWYKQDLSGTHLQASLVKELDDSQYLIVICSPSSAKSEWVNKEVMRFLELGRGNKIIPLIIGGTPHAANPADECLPSALRVLPKEKELRGIDLRRKEGKNHALVDVIATILGVRFNELWQRHQRRRRKIIRRIITTLLILIPCIAMQVEYKQPYIEYYADYVDQWGVPVGVVPLSKEQVAHRHDSYRFTYHRIPLSEPNALNYRIKEVAHINSVNAVVEHSNLEFVKRSAIMEIEYSKQTGLPTQILYSAADGTIKYRHDLSTHNSVIAAIADFKSATEDMGSDFAQSNTASMEVHTNNAKSNIKRYAYERDENGYITKITYHSNNDDVLSNSVACDGNGIYGARFFRDSIGRILRVEYIDKKGKITCTKKGVAGYQYTYGNMGSVNSYLYFDVDGNPIFNDQKWASSVELIDQYGNTYWGFFYDEEGNLCNCSDGYAQYKYEHDEYGNKIKKMHYDADTVPCLTNEGISIWTKTFNSYNECTEIAYYDTNGNPCLCDKGYAKETMKLNLMGKCTERSFYGLDGKPCLCTKEYAKVIHKYNLWENCVSSSYFDTIGQPAMYCGFYSVVKREFDEYGRSIKESLYDGQGNPIYLSGSEVTTWRGKYNSLGQVTEHAYYNEKDQLCNGTDSSAILKIKYSARGEILEMANYDANQQPCLIVPQGYFKETYTYNDRGLCTEVRYYGVNNQLCLQNNEYAICKFEYDRYGNYIKKSYFDTKNKLICVNGYAIQKMTYDKRGNCIEIIHLDQQKQLSEDKQGVAIYQFTYNKRGDILSETRLDKNNQVVQ